MVITAVLMGIAKGTGIDIDPCAIAEAGENIKINGLENRIDICNRAFEKVHRVFSMVTANLRYPTIKRLLPYMLFPKLPSQNWSYFTKIKAKY